MGRGVIDLPLNEIAADIFRVESSRYWNKFEVVSEHLCTLVVVVLVNIIGSVEQASHLSCRVDDDRHPDHKSGTCSISYETLHCSRACLSWTRSS